MSQKDAPSKLPTDVVGADDELAAPPTVGSSTFNFLESATTPNRTLLVGLDSPNDKDDDDEEDNKSDEGSDEEMSEHEEEDERDAFTRPADNNNDGANNIDQEVEKYLHSRGRCLSPQQTPSQALRAAAEELLLKLEVSESKDGGTPGRSDRKDGVEGSSMSSSPVRSRRHIHIGSTPRPEVQTSNKKDVNAPKMIPGVLIEPANTSNTDGLLEEGRAAVPNKMVPSDGHDDDSEDEEEQTQSDSVYTKAAIASSKKQPPYMPRNRRRCMIIAAAVLGLVIVAALVIALVPSYGGGNQNEKSDDSSVSLNTDADVMITSNSSSPPPTVLIPPVADTTLPVSVPTSSPTAIAVEKEYVASPLCSHIPYSGHDVFTFSFRRWGTDKPVRYFRIYTPRGFDPSEPNKIVFLYHGRSGRQDFMNADMRSVADEHGYVLVAVDGLSENDSRSFAFPGSEDGIGRDGMTATTCNTEQTTPNYCTSSCQSQGRCNYNRCGFSHCQDSDVELFIDIVNEVASKFVCVDHSQIYVYGFDQGGMLAWSLAQDPRSSPLIAGIGVAQGLPLHDYLVGKGDSSSIPAIGIYSNVDCVVPPGNGTNTFNEGCDGEGYRYVDAFRQHKLWAEEHGCSVGNTFQANYLYTIEGRDEVACTSHCDPAKVPPMSVDCRNSGGHGKQPWHLDVAIKFFEDHRRHQK